MEKVMTKFITTLIFVYTVGHCIGQSNHNYDIHIDAPGTILNYIEFNNIDNVKSLTISGKLNIEDIRVVRKMNQLKKLDLKNAIIIDEEAMQKELKLKRMDLGYQALLEHGMDVSQDKINELKKKIEGVVKEIADKYYSGSILTSNMFKKLKIESIILPKNIKEIDSFAFCECEELTYIILPDGITSLGKSAFEGCSNLSDIYLPTGLKTVGDYLFKNCSSINTISFNSDISRIGSGFFYGCTNLQEITFRNVGEISLNFVCKCPSLRVIHSNSEKAPKKYTGYAYSDNCYESNNQDIILYFPKESATSYVASEWDLSFILKAK
jgi:hypothetical protein